MNDISILPGAFSDVDLNSRTQNNNEANVVVVAFGGGKKGDEVEIKAEGDRWEGPIDCLER